MLRLTVLTLGLTAAALAQDAGPMTDASVALVNPMPQTGVQDLSNVMRTMADCRDVSYDESARTFHLRGTSAQIALAEWAVRQVDLPAGAVLPSQPLSYNYLGGTGRETPNSAVRLFFLDQTDSIADMQDYQNILRTGADIQRVFAFTPLKAIFARSEAVRVTMAEWLISQLDRPAEPGKTASYNYPGSDADRANPLYSRVTAVRVFFLAHITTPREMQDMLNITRTGADIQRVFQMASRHALIIRAEPERAALAQWLVQHLDQEPKAGRTAVSYDYVDPVFPVASRTVHVFYLNHEQPPPAVQALQTRMRTEATLQRVFFASGANAIVVGGRPEQVAAAEKMVAQAEETAGNSK